MSLVDSDAIAKVRERFTNKYGEAEGIKFFELFFEKIIKFFNKKLQEEKNPIQFTSLASTYSEDYTPFEEVVVAKLKALYVEEALKILREEVEKEVGIQIRVQEASSYHVTIATKYREPNPSLKDVKIEKILNETGKYSDTLNAYWQELIKREK